jgi:hypothetical protein
MARDDLLLNSALQQVLTKLGGKGRYGASEVVSPRETEE